MFKKKSSSTPTESKIEQLPEQATAAQIEDKVRELVDKINGQ